MRPSPFRYCRDDNPIQMIRRDLPGPFALNDESCGASGLIEPDNAIGFNKSSFDGSGNRPLCWFVD